MIKLKNNKQIGVGVDIEKTARFVDKKRNSQFLNRLYTNNELSYCFEKSHPSESLAGRFAAKESIKKALTNLVGQAIDHKEIEILNDKLGAPIVFMRNGMGNKFEFSLSISHTKDTAIAFVLAIPKTK